MAKIEQRTDTTYVAEYVYADADQWLRGRQRELYRGPSLAAARRSCADALGYRHLRSAAEWTGETAQGHDTLIYCRRREADREGAAVARIYIDPYSGAAAARGRAEYDVQA